MEKLPTVLSTYFEASNAQDTDAYVACFRDDAKVEDENHTYQGHEQIAAWNRDVNEKYNAVSTVKSWLQTSDTTNVTAEVSGTFPGSPIDLTFSFQLRDNKISQLEIA